MLSKLLEKDARIVGWFVVGIGVLWIFLILAALRFVAG